uniref:(northern house mosquito) hypothetical protein n=1 Tax=Culex pipiens TaxID=7175 RepID=A0A8D8C0Z5_CULPI
MSRIRKRPRSGTANDRPRRWTGSGSRSGIRSGGARTGCRKRPNRTSGSRTSRPSGPRPAPSPSSIWAVSRCLSRAGCRCARRRSKCSGTLAVAQSAHSFTSAATVCAWSRTTPRD